MFLSLQDNELLARNLFVVAYIWGFGGHLHPRYVTKCLERSEEFKCEVF